MDCKTTAGSDTVVAGFGSPFGDDQAGWQVVERLAGSVSSPTGRPTAATARVRFVRVREGTQLLGELHGCRRLVVVDACRGSGRPGTISRYRWPDARLRLRHDRSTHDVGLDTALQLASQLGKLPAEVVVFGVEMGGDDLREVVGDGVRRAVETLVEMLQKEIGGGKDA